MRRENRTQYSMVADIREMLTVKEKVRHTPGREESMNEKTEFATFAGGCFWCTEHAFLDIPGVLAVTSGYTGGYEDFPYYEDVCAGKTGHMEAARVEYDPAHVRYRDLLDVFWRSIDPTDSGGQFADRGSQYRTAIFYHTDEQRTEAEASRDEINASGRFHKPVVTSIEPARKFFPAEDYHQKYCLKNPEHFHSYHHGSGHQAGLASLWGESRAETNYGVAEPMDRRNIPRSHPAKKM